MPGERTAASLTRWIFDPLPAGFSVSVCDTTPSRVRTDQQDTAIGERQKAWDRDVSGKMAALLRQMRDSPVYGLTRSRPLPPEQHGVYMLIDDTGDPQYVGRVGLTDRSRRAGKRFSSFRTRVRSHTVPRHNNGTYAYVRACEHFRSLGRELALTRKGNCEDAEFMVEFRRQCDIVRDMGVQVVEIDDNKVAAVFEIYAATVLGLSQSFAVS